MTTMSPRSAPVTYLQLPKTSSREDPLTPSGRPPAHADIPPGTLGNHFAAQILPSVVTQLIRSRWHLLTCGGPEMIESIAALPNKSFWAIRTHGDAQSVRNFSQRSHTLYAVRHERACRVRVDRTLDRRRRGNRRPIAASHTRIEAFLARQRDASAPPTPRDIRRFPRWDHPLCHPGLSGRRETCTGSDSIAWPNLGSCSSASGLHCAVWNLDRVTSLERGMWPVSFRRMTHGAMGRSPL